jgi:hypothetical protein
MPRSRIAQSSLRVCDGSRALKYEVLNCHATWASLCQPADPSPDPPDRTHGAKKGASSSSSDDDEKRKQQQRDRLLLPKVCWDVIDPVLWDANEATTVSQVAESLLWAIFTSLRHEVQLGGCQAVVQDKASKWHQLLKDVSPNRYKQNLEAEEWKELQQEAAVRVFTNPLVRVKEVAGHLYNGQQVTQQHEACMVVQQRQVFRWVFNSLSLDSLHQHSAAHHFMITVLSDR